MSNKLFFLLGIAATIIIGTFLYLQFCCNCCMPVKAVQNETTKRLEVNLNPFVLNGSGMNYQCNDNLNFLKNNSALITPVSDSIVLGLEKLKRILMANPEQKITITGYATTLEKNTTKFKNLGLARANDVRTFFTFKGLPKAQLDIKGEVVDTWEMLNDTLSGPVKYTFNDLNSVPEKDNVSNTLKDEINANPLVLHFDTNQSIENLSKKEHQKVIEITQYIIRTPDAAVLIVGHSDNSGNRKSNILLAQKRANFTKSYLIKNGIRASRIETQSKGPDDPVAENETAEGKAKNRRTVITIK